MNRSDILLYLFLRFFKMFNGKPLYGRKKIQKLMFLVEHYDPVSRRIIPSTGLTGYKFVIWGYGPFSKEIYDDLDLLVRSNYIVEEVIGSDSVVSVEGIRLSLYIDDGFPKRMFVYRPGKLNVEKELKKLVSRLPLTVVDKIDLILKNYGMCMPHELEGIINKMMDLTMEKKLRYWGRSVDDYLREEGIA